MRGEERSGDESKGEEIILASDEAETVNQTSTKTVFSALVKLYKYPI